MQVSVVDIFAGPGGLSEGFTSVVADDGAPAYDVVLSVEKDAWASKTLKLRAFFREFDIGAVPEDYYRLLRGEINLERLYELYIGEANKADTRIWQAELGSNQIALGDVRTRIDKATADKKDMILIGGPPCQAYSIIGRSRRKGNPDYQPIKDARQFLYIEYLQILADHSPVAFVMENVKGLLSAKLNSKYIFRRMLEDLEAPAAALKREGRTTRGRANPRYRVYSLVEQTLLNDTDIRNSIVASENYGIPQTRHRVILLGIREDLDIVATNVLLPRNLVPTAKVLDGLPVIRSGLSKCRDSTSAWEDFLRKQIGSRWANGGTRRSDSENLIRRIRKTLKNFRAPELGRGAEFISIEAPTEYARDWFFDPRLGGVCNHTSRAHIGKDLCRYLYAACYAAEHGISPKLQQFPADLLPDHANARIAIKEGANFSDRFRVQLSDRPASTVTSHIHKDGHYYIHPDPFQCRSLTVREAARLQTFPDNYYFVGPRTAQYIQVGNAVPPLLAKQIGEIAFKVLQKAGVVR